MVQVCVVMRFHMLFNNQEMETGDTLHYSTDFTKILPKHAIGCTRVKEVSYSLQPAILLSYSGSISVPFKPVAVHTMKAYGGVKIQIQSSLTLERICVR